MVETQTKMSLPVSVPSDSNCCGRVSWKYLIGAEFRIEEATENFPREVTQHLKKLPVQTQAASRRVSRAAIQEADMAVSQIAVLSLQRANRNLKASRRVLNPSQSFQKPKRSLPLRRNG